MSPTARRVACLALLLSLAISITAAAHPTDAAALTARFAAMTGDGWTGGDASWSAPLPDGRRVWLFGDTFIGGVDASGHRDPAAPMVHNSMLVDDGSSFRTVIGGTSASPEPVVPGESDSDWYWPGPPVVGRDLLQVPMTHVRRTGPGGWDFAATGTSLAVFSLPDLELQSVSPIATPADVHMGAGSVSTRRFTYVFGARGTGLVKDAFVARVPGRGLQAQWQYWDGHGWTADPSTAVPVLSGVADQFSIVHRHGRWTIASQQPMSPDVLGFDAPRPQGPWRPIGTIARIPAIPHALTYNATLHPEYSSGRDLVLGYNVMADDTNALWSDAALYRPHFMTVRTPS